MNTYGVPSIGAGQALRTNVNKYDCIAMNIAAQIEEGHLKPGDKLPTVVELCETFNVSKVTVRKALELLAEQGLVSTRRGSGTYVKKAPETKVDILYQGRSDKATGFTAEHSGAESEISTVVYDFSIVEADDKIASYLDIQPGDFAYYDCRVRLLDGSPIVIEYTYMPLERIPGMKRCHVEGSIYSFLQNDVGLTLGSFHRIVRAKKATREEAKRLDIAAGDPLLEIEQIGFLDSGEPFEYSISRNVGERYELHNVVLV